MNTLPPPIGTPIILTRDFQNFSKGETLIVRSHYYHYYDGGVVAHREGERSSVLVYPGEFSVVNLLSLLKQKNILSSELNNLNQKIQHLVSKTPEWNGKNLWLDAEKNKVFFQFTVHFRFEDDKEYFVVIDLNEQFFSIEDEDEENWGNYPLDFLNKAGELISFHYKGDCKYSYSIISIEGDYFTVNDSPKFPIWVLKVLEVLHLQLKEG